MSALAPGTYHVRALQFWQKDSETKACYECAREFNLFVRKHHCRMCGGYASGHVRGLKMACSVTATSALRAVIVTSITLAGFTAISVQTTFYRRLPCLTCRPRPHNDAATDVRVPHAHLRLTANYSLFCSNHSNI